MSSLTTEQQADLVEIYCNRAVDDMSDKDKDQMIFEMLLDAYMLEHENDIQAMIVSAYGQDYYDSLVQQVTEEGE